MPADEGVGIDEIATEVVVYPNPTDGQVTIVYSENITSVEVYDLSGKLVYSESNLLNNKIQIDLTSFERGVYSFRLMTNDQMINGKVVKD